MGINLLSYPYVDSTITRGDITFTDLGNGSLSAQGTKSGAAYIRLESYDTLTLEAGTYTMRGTGYSYLAYTVELKTTEGTSTYLDVDASNKTFTVSESVTVRVDLDVSAVRGTEIPRTVVYPQLEAGTELSPWTPYRPPTTIDAENAKQIRQTMDVVIQVTPEQGEPIVINNSNLISCTVSLRSDLSIIEPTLPESEINIEAYFDDDISDVLASIPDETPVTYQAGYPGDMSPVRNFYLAEQITWQDNVMSIHAVDAVHKLDAELSPGQLGDISRNNATITRLYMSFLYAMDACGVTPNRPDGRLATDNDSDGGDRTSLIPQTTFRDWIARVMWLFHVELPTGLIADDTGYWLTYVDAGIPTARWKKPTSKWDIYEDDCGDVKRNVGRAIGSLTIKRVNLVISFTNTIWSTSLPEVGDITMIKDVGASMNFDDYVYVYGFMFKGTDGVNRRPVPVDPDGSLYEAYLPNRTTALNASVASRQQPFGRILMQSGLPQGAVGDNYTQFVPWSSSMSSAWSSLVSGSETEVSGWIAGKKVNIDEVVETYQSGSTGEDVVVDNAIWYGEVITKGTIEPEPSTATTVFPNLSIQSLLSRSNITGSFTWKGDPRMQPRDVVTFHRLDGTTEDITIENITITHEKGGTSAELTYRKGIC